MKRTILFLLLDLLIINCYSQDLKTKSDTIRKDALNIFMDATDYIKKEIPYVNYVRDIKDAGLYIISTTQTTGSGGIEHSYFFVGQHQYSAMKDTLKFDST
jgi:hypothetical protein